MNLPPISATPQTRAADTEAGAAKSAAIWDSAKQLEAVFLSEMLKATGFGDAREGLGSGGAGEDQFSSFLRDAQATEMVKAGGIGIAETLFHALMETEND